jgi:AcrR family transcriptional regulator
MTSAYARKKQPDVVRRDLLQSAITLAARQGVSALSLQQVAEAAGVTKGGLLHHFPNKQALVDAVFDVLMTQFGESLQDAMALDPEPHGRFTRAYLDLSLVEVSDLDEGSALWRSVVTDPHLSARWGGWLTEQLAQLGGSETGPALEAVRFAADGIWMGLFANITPADRDALRTYLRNLTYLAHGARD